MQTTPLKYRALTTRRGYRQIDQALLDMARLYNALIRHRESAHGLHRRKWSPKLQTRALTELRSQEPRYNRYSRRLLESVAKRVNTSYNEFFKNPTEKGKPHTIDPYRFNTLEVCEPRSNHLKISGDGSKGYIHIKGLPRLQFRTDSRLPTDTQPRIIRITRTARRFNMCLVFQIDKQMDLASNRSVGIDPGVKHLITAVDETGDVLQVPGLDDNGHRKGMRRLRRKVQRQRNAAIKDGRARFTSHKRRDGKVKLRFRWTNGPSRNYLKVMAQLRRVEQKRQDSLTGLQHRISSRLVEEHQVVAIEDTRIRNMTRSAKGTVENPGKNVRQKAGLNRSILFQGWYGLRLKLEYKCQWYGRDFIKVPAMNTSLLCSKCGAIHEGNRRSQAVFKCWSCGFTTNADVNAAENIRRLGLALLAREENGFSTSVVQPPGRAAGVPSGKEAHTGCPEAAASRLQPALHA